MRFLRVLAIVAAASTVSAAEIPAGTHLLLRMEHSISSRTAKVGDGVHLRTSVPISAGGRIVVPIGSYAQGVISEVKRGKPHPDLLSLAVKLLKAKPAATVMIGDTPYDAQAARHLKVWPVGVMSGHFPASELRAAGCREVFRDLVDFYRMLSPPAENERIEAQAS